MSVRIVVLRAWTLALGVLSLLVACSAPRAPGLSFGLHASRDPDVIERGRYLVQGPGHCASCHGDPAREHELRAGHEIPLAGGRLFDLGVAGEIIAPNLTSDPATGIGALSDDVLVRSLRYGISRHGRPLAPFMPYANLADADLIAILSYLRTLAPVVRATPPSKLSWLGTFGIHFIMDPQSPTTTPPKRVAPTLTAEYGDYLAHTIANCRGCHTARSKLSGTFIGPAFGGGMRFVERTGTFVAPNLTPVANGVLGSTEREFVARFRIEGRALTGSPMPWEAYARMTDEDLGAIYRYLRTVPPANVTADQSRRSLSRYASSSGGRPLR